MSHISAEDRARAAETKRKRTRDKLIHAADRVFEDHGLDATIEAIAEEARMSVATFYNYYDTRNDLCTAAFTELVVAVLEPMIVPAMTLQERLDALAGLVEGREMLTRAALVGRLEAGRWNSPDGFAYVDGQRRMYPADFIDRLSWTLWPGYQGWLHQADREPIPDHAYRPLHAAALEVLDQVARGRPVDAESFSWIDEL